MFMKVDAKTGKAVRYPGIFLDTSLCEESQYSGVPDYQMLKRLASALLRVHHTISYRIRTINGFSFLFKKVKCLIQDIYSGYLRWKD